MSQQLYVDVHVLQTVPPSNLNRDDAGTPKQATYGGVTRARVSSQAWKRATRLAFEERLNVPSDQLGTRSKRVIAQLADRLNERTALDRGDARRLANALLKKLGLSASKKKQDESAYLLFYGRAQLERIADLVADQAHELAALPDDALDKAAAEFDLQAILTSGHSLDVALFGRMVADLPALNVDAAVQVAHAISTHETTVEFDYYTAVDDAKDRVQEDAGAGMIGTVEFTAATLYRHATVGMHQLTANLEGRTPAALDALAVFLEGFVLSMPAGHKNTFAHHTLPSLVSVVVRKDQPVNLVSAFEKPVRSKDGSAAKSAQRLDEELARVESQWGLVPLRTASQYDQGAVPQPAALGPCLPFREVVATIKDELSSQLESRQ